MKESNIIFYRTPADAVKIEIRFEDKTFWLTQKNLAELIGVEVQSINYHLKEKFKSGELEERTTIRKIRIVQTEGNREVIRSLDFYNLDANIAIGYQVNSYQVSHSRQGRIVSRSNQIQKLTKEWIERGIAKFQQNSFPHNVGKLDIINYICTNRTRHASHTNSVPGRVFYFHGYAV